MGPGPSPPRGGRATPGPDAQRPAPSPLAEAAGNGRHRQQAERGAPEGPGRALACPSLASGHGHSALPRPRDLKEPHPPTTPSHRYPRVALSRLPGKQSQHRDTEDTGWGAQGPGRPRSLLSAVLNPGMNKTLPPTPARIRTLSLGLWGACRGAQSEAAQARAPRGGPHARPPAEARPPHRARNNTPQHPLHLWHPKSKQPSNVNQAPPPSGGPQSWQLSPSAVGRAPGHSLEVGGRQGG